MYRNLEAEMVRKGITQNRLAELLNLNSSTISLKMNGKRDFSYKEALRIKAILDVDIPLEKLFSQSSA